MLETALHTSNLRDKIRISTDAATLDNHYVDPLIVRRQTYLLLVSLTFSQQAQAMDYADYLDKARIDFDRAITLDAKNVWAWIGKGDVLARQQADSKSWHHALATLKKLPNAQTPESWIPYQKEACALRSETYLKLNQPEQGIEDLSSVIRVAPPPMLPPW